MKQGAKTSPDGPLFIIAGGGTAGHVMPGLAVAEALVEAGHPRDRVHFIGARRGMEATMVPARRVLRQPVRRARHRPVAVAVEPAGVLQPDRRHPARRPSVPPHRAVGRGLRRRATPACRR